MQVIFSCAVQKISLDAKEGVENDLLTVRDDKK